jgi:uncharacterized protein (DUF2141 family)
MKKMVLITMVLFLAILNLNCDLNAYEPKQVRTKDLAAEISYIQDKRTGLCFAVFEQETRRDGCYRFGMSNVPCESISGKLLKKGGN